MSAPRFPFTKMHGLGNDFIVVDLRGAVAAPWLESPAFIAELCERRRGIGADGVLALLPPTESARHEGAVARLRIRNADGSEPEMCGNGLRCVARYLRDRDGLGSSFSVETGAGLRGCSFSPDGQIELAMGRPTWSSASFPLRLPLDEGALDLYCLSMGNPHAVSFVPSAPPVDELWRLAERLGPTLERAAPFPQRTNVEFARSDGDDRLQVVVWERGCGITQACGTGACATAVAACLTGRATAGRWLAVTLPGGTLEVHVAADYSQVLLRGPAVEVYRGELG